MQEAFNGQKVVFGTECTPQCSNGLLMLPVEVVEGALAIVGVGLSVPPFNHPLSLQLVDVQVCAASHPLSCYDGKTVCLSVHAPSTFHPILSAQSSLRRDSKVCDGSSPVLWQKTSRTECHSCRSLRQG